MKFIISEKHCTKGYAILVIRYHKNNKTNLVLLSLGNSDGHELRRLHRVLSPTPHDGGSYSVHPPLRGRDGVLRRGGGLHHGQQPR